MRSIKVKKALKQAAKKAETQGKVKYKGAFKLLKDFFQQFQMIFTNHKPLCLFLMIAVPSDFIDNNNHMFRRKKSDNLTFTG